MEHPSKRRRIERQATGSLRALLHLDTKRQPLKEHIVVPATPDLVVSSTITSINGHAVGNPSSATLRVRGSRDKHLELRGVVLPPVKNNINQVQPNGNDATDLQAAGTSATNAVQSAQQAAGAALNQGQQATGNVASDQAQPVQQAVQPVLNQTPQTADAITQPVQQAAQPVKDQIVQPTVDTANKAVDAVNDKTAQAPAAIPAPNPEQAIKDAPGLVTPSPALAAAAAREKALAEQQAKAAQVDPNVPSTEGPAPAQLPGASVGTAKQVIPQDALLSSSQITLSSLPTPLPQIPTPSSPSSYFSTLQQPSPTLAPNLAASISPGSSQLTSTNSSLTTSLSSTTTLSLSIPSASASSSGTGGLDFLGGFTAPGSSSGGQSTSFNASTVATTSLTSVPSTFVTSTPTASPSESDNGLSFNSGSLSPTDGSGLVGANPTAGGPASATTTASSSSSDSSGPPPTGALVGGICGGVAGLVLIIAALLFLFRYRKRKHDQRREISPPIPQSAGAGSAALGGGVMTQRSSIRSTAPIAAAANLIGRLRPGSSQTATTTSTAPSEKGFQKISGRKIPSVLHSGGDGWGEKSAVGPSTSSKPPPRSIAPGQSPFAGLAPGLRPPSPQRSLSGSSFYRDSHGFYGGVGLVDPASEEKTVSSASPTSSSPTIPVGPSSGIPFAAAGHPPGRSSPGIPNIRPGPARQPVIQQGGVVPTRTPSRPGTSQQRPTTSPIAEHPFSRDPLGRSRPSQDGSRQSRFRESTTPP